MTDFELPQATHYKKRVIFMAGTSFLTRVRSVAGVLALTVVFLLPGLSHAQVDRVTTVKTEEGWKLQVNGEDYFMKGVVWGYSPRGQNYSYGLFNQSDDFIRKVLDYEFGLMADAGINTIRTFTMIPPEWVEYIYREHGIMSVVNPLMGRYGYNVDGKWIPFTDYSDPRTREVLRQDMAEFVRRYKDTPGVIMFAFGNESNYGLSWSSFEIENLPVGEQNTAKARYLYSLWEEVIADGKAIAPDHLFTIVNGDIQYIDLIAELVPSLDILGSNVYRGPSFTTLWEEADEKLDLPVAFFEFGSDAFNARSFREDQAAQAAILKSQWQEMYNKAAGNGEEGNAIGAFVFEWRDEWWKYLQIERLDIQDTNASWSNQAYLFDWAEGQNNMNEEWFGIMALGEANSDGVYTARPRMAYYMLADVFEIDPYTSSKQEINQHFAAVDMEFLELKGDVEQLKAENYESSKKLSFTGGRFQGEFAVRGFEQDITEDGKGGLEFSDGEMVFLDFGFRPTDNIEGQFTVNLLGNVAQRRPLEFNYGDRGLPLTVNVDTAIELIDGGVEFESQQVVFDDRERVEIYDFEATYTGENVDVTAFYHTPRFHWGYEGDFFGLIREATDTIGQDVWNAKAPSGIEFQGKNQFSNLRLVAGPEIYWGANPKFVFKYDFNLLKADWTFIHSEDVARLDTGPNATDPTLRQSRQTTLFLQKKFSSGIELELGGIMSATERIDEVFDYCDLERIPGTTERRCAEGSIRSDQIEFEDTLGFRGRLTFPLGPSRNWIGGYYSGLVAEGGSHLPLYGIMDPTGLPYSGLGNRQEVEAGSQIFLGNWMIMPRGLYRTNLVDANVSREAQINNGILNQGIIPRNRDDDPFAVIDNREARAGEIFFTWDPTGATPFYDWDNDWREDAPFAFNIGGTYTEFTKPTDSNLFFFEPISANAPFGVGLPEEDVWSVKSRMIFNTKNNNRYILRLEHGLGQSTGDPNGGSREYWQLNGRAIWGNGRHSLEGYYMKDMWGPYDFFRQFNLTFPQQIRLDYSIWVGSGLTGLVDPIAQLSATKIGFRTTFRTTDENSPDDEFRDGLNDYSFLSVLYFTYQF